MPADQKADDAHRRDAAPLAELNDGQDAPKSILPCKDTAMGNQDAGRAEVIPSLEGAEGPERGGERMDTTEASRDYAAAQDAAADDAGALGAQQRADIAWPRLRQCYHILMRLGREADLKGVPDPPSDMQAFRHLAGQGWPADTTAETEHV